MALSAYSAARFTKAGITLARKQALPPSRNEKALLGVDGVIGR